MKKKTLLVIFLTLGVSIGAFFYVDSTLNNNSEKVSRFSFWSVYPEKNDMIFPAIKISSHRRTNRRRFSFFRIPLEDASDLRDSKLNKEWSSNNFVHNSPIASSRSYWSPQKNGAGELSRRLNRISPSRSRFRSSANGGLISMHISSSLTGRSRESSVNYGGSSILGFNPKTSLFPVPRTHNDNSGIIIIDPGVDPEEDQRIAPVGDGLYLLLLLIIGYAGVKTKL